MPDIIKNQQIKLVFSIVDADNNMKDISSASSMSLVMRRIGSASKTVTPVNSTDGKDGKVEYLTLTNDLNEIGLWRAQVIVVIGGVSYPSSAVEFNVVSGV